MVVDGREIPVDDVPVMSDREQIQMFFRDMFETHPHYWGKQFTFIERNESELSDNGDSEKPT